MSQTEANRIVGSEKAEHSAELQGGEYWSPERQKAARPVQLQTVPGATRVSPEQAPAGVEPGHVEPGRPHSDFRVPDATLVGGHPVLNPLAFPYSACGKVFFNQGTGSFSGSAAMISPNVLLTAGHCVYAGGNWSSNFTFYPSYPLRQNVSFKAQRLAAWTAWTQSGNRAYDYGLAWIGNNAGNQTGWLGLLWNASTTGRVWDAVGYPATPNPPFDGSKMDEALGTFAASSVSGTIGLTHDNMEHGSSGGPWITDFNGSARVYANGLQSFHIHDGDFVEFGPYFTADIKTLLDWITNPANH
jgi:V8-like Glu-specific endopeptidase